ncbi:MAG: cadherin, partial [Thiolinea sp.]
MIKNTFVLSMVGLFLAVSSLQAKEQEAGVVMGIQWDHDSQTYLVTATPNLTPDVDINLSAQITLRVPHSDDDNKKFMAEQVVSHIEGYRWIETSRANAPEEARDSDYLSFSFAPENRSRLPFGWKKDETKVLFSFVNGGECLGDVQLMSDDDPFNAPLNSLNTNPGNQFTNMGWGNINRN